MNEEAIQQAYDVFKSRGYNGSIDDYKQLISTNGNALKQTYDIFKQGGYNEDINSFKNLIGIGSIKKKVNPKMGVQLRPLVHWNYRSLKTILMAIASLHIESKAINGL